MTSPPGVVAHRGLAARYPENTIEGLEAAMDHGANTTAVHITARNEMSFCFMMFCF